MAGLASSMYTSQKLPLKNPSRCWTAFPNSYSAKHWVMSLTHALSLASTHASLGRVDAPSNSPGPLTCLASGMKSPSPPSMKRHPCQILLQKLRYPTTLLMSRLMSRPWTVYARRPIRSASAPHLGMPSVSAKSSSKSRFALATSLAGRLPPSTFSHRASSEQPWITSSGSITFPRDLDILRPSLSRTMACRYTSLKGSWSVNASDIITMRATQKKRMSRPVSSRELGKKPCMSGVSSGQPMVEKGKRPLLNHVSKTSGSCANTTSCGLHLRSLAALSRAWSSERATIHRSAYCSAFWSNSPSLFKDAK
mmetsp:Transcript_34107/g.77028  ORF Transcript_34107/g.77028 Transcript_34107/m.77028 type:complete len:309 (+) Transcript_34107:948-1874(+)